MLGVHIPVMMPTTSSITSGSSNVNVQLKVIQTTFCTNENTKEVRKQISSIKSTRKITSALEMVAASKIKKTQDLMFGGRPYSEKVKEVIEHIASSSSEYSHPFYEERKICTRLLFGGNIQKQPEKIEKIEEISKVREKSEDNTQEIQK